MGTDPERQDAGLSCIRSQLSVSWAGVAAIVGHYASSGTFVIEECNGNNDCEFAEQFQCGGIDWHTDWHRYSINSSVELFKLGSAAFSGARATTTACCRADHDGKYESRKGIKMYLANRWALLAVAAKRVCLLEVDKLVGSI